MYDYVQKQKELKKSVELLTEEVAELTRHKTSLKKEIGILLIQQAANAKGAQKALSVLTIPGTM